MRARKLGEAVATTTIGDGATALIAPGEHLLLPVGPEGTRRVARCFAYSPYRMRLLNRSDFGVWLPPKQYREG